MSEPLHVEVDGRTWHLFSFEYDTADGKFGGSLYAISMEHAAARLMELKESARLVGQVGAVIPFGESDD